MTMLSYDAQLDVTGLKCPLPILKAKKALAQLETGQRLLVLTTDAAAPEDFTAFCRQTGHELQSLNTLANGVFELVIKHR